MEENFSKKVEYIEVYEMSGLGVNSASFGGANLSKQYVFGVIDTNPWLSKSRMKVPKESYFMGLTASWSDYSMFSINELGIVHIQ